MALHDLCVGLGQHCESSYQIRRITGQQQAHFFDWTGVTLDNVIRIIDADFPVLLRSGRVVPKPDGRGARDLDTWLSYIHDFIPQPGATLTLDDVEEQLPKVREKFIFLAERWRAMAASDARVLYIRQDPEGIENVTDLRRLQETIARRFPGHRFAILWLRREAPEHVEELPPGIAYREVPLLPGRWEGDDAAWDELFASLPERTLWSLPRVQVPSQ
ncbi:DUF1796 family putative cysteine peptidase [Psychromicrobium sp. YIM B11713]|uniref:DUF1796 family putative cysteine peptidase n=1 Tax=Psychromicrobium sp. YIM B11713 TaxID=3145233 RepID=UPI00374E85FE